MFRITFCNASWSSFPWGSRASQKCCLSLLLKSPKPWAVSERDPASPGELWHWWVSIKTGIINQNPSNGIKITWVSLSEVHQHFNSEFLDTQVCRFVQELVWGVEHNRFLPAAQQILFWMKKYLLEADCFAYAACCNYPTRLHTHVTHPVVNGSLLARHELCEVCKNYTC